MLPDVKNLTTPELINLYSQVLAELEARNILKFSSVVGGYTEWIVAEKLGLEIMPNSTKGYDGIDLQGIKYQIKGRITKKREKQLGDIPDLEKREFNFLIAVIYNSHFNIQEVYKIPHSIVEKYAKSKKGHHVLHITKRVITDPEVDNITALFIESK